MTIWNALAAGGALFCVFMMTGASCVAAFAAVERLDTIRAAIVTLALSCLGFGLCFWGAIP